jgi:hypothetical protein
MDDKAISLKKNGHEPCPAGVVCEIHIVGGRSKVMDPNLRELRSFFLSLLGVFLGLAICLFIVAKFPFKTLEYGPMEVTDAAFQNPVNKVPLGGVVHVRIPYKKFTDAPGMVVRTLIRKKGSEIIPLDSNTLISTRPASEGIAHAIFALTLNPEIMGKETYLVFTTYYNLFGFIPRMVQGEAGPFEIVAPEEPPPCPPKASSSWWARRWRVAWK